MAGPAFTVDNIRTHAPGVLTIFTSLGGADKVLQKLAPHLDKMGSPEGRTCIEASKPFNVQVNWNRDASDTINGFFVCIYRNDPYGVSLEAYKMVGNVGNEVLLAFPPVEERPASSNRIIQDTFDHHFQARFILTQNTFYADHKITPFEGKIPFNQHLDEILELDEVKAFFAKHPEMLENLKQMNQVTEASAPNYLYWGGGILLLIACVFVAKKYLFRASSKPTFEVV